MSTLDGPPGSIDERVGPRLRHRGGEHTREGVAGVMHVHPMLANFDPLWSIVLLFAINFTGLVAAAHLGWRIRSNLREAERKLAVQAWQLRQLLPRGAQA